MQHHLPIVIAHRGASGYLPEHTLEAYALAIDQGADYIEPDLVTTRDGHLIARHEPNLVATTNVRDLARFASRETLMRIDGVEQRGFFASDFTLAEVCELRARQLFAGRDQSHNDRYAIPTFAQIVALAQRKSHELGRHIGVYAETKHPSHHQALGLALEERLLSVLREAGWDQRASPVFIQSFETANLKYLRERCDVRLIQLIGATGLTDEGAPRLLPPDDKPYDWTLQREPRTYADMLTPSGLAEIGGYADGIGPWKRFLVSARNLTGNDQAPDSARWLLPPSRVVDDAHRAGLLVHCWTMRSEASRLAADYKGEAQAEYLQFYHLGVDGVFSDFPDAAVAARKKLADRGYYLE